MSCIYGDAVKIVGVVYIGQFVLRTLFHLVNGFRIHALSKILPAINLVDKYGKWAVVTGCTDGIGRAYARELARRGVNVVLISRTRSKLEEIAKEIEEEFKVETKIIAINFNQGMEIYDRIENELQSLEVGILVNNVGMALPFPMRVDEASRELLLDSVTVNVVSATQMSRIFLPAMKERRRGIIVNLSSITTLQPVPLFAIYGACKTAVDSFSRALQVECRGSGVEVQTLSPAFVQTKLVAYSSVWRHENLLVPSAATYAKHSVDTLGRTSRTCGYFIHGIQFWYSRLYPVWVSTEFTYMFNKNDRANYDQEKLNKRQ